VAAETVGNGSVFGQDRADSLAKIFGNAMTTAPIIIIGAGQAGIRAAETLRKLGCDEPIVMFGDESYPPYQRPPLSKKFLAGEMAEDRLFLQSDNFFELHRIDFVKGTRVTAIEPRERRVQVAGASAPVSYCKLLIATGCHARPLPAEIGGGVPFDTLRSIDDVRRLREKTAAAARIAIIGGGYIGLEVAAVLKGMGKAVTVLEAQSCVMSRVTCERVADYFLRLHRQRGVDIRLDAKVARIRKADSEYTLELADGESIAADFVLASIGGAPTDALACEAGLPCQDGILVDEHCRVAPDIFAAGDCTRFPSARYGRLIRLESVQNANDQGRAAAEAILGQGAPYDPVPWFWSDQYEIKLQIAGLSEGYDSITMEGNPDDNAFAVSYFKAGRLIAVDAINMGRAHMLARRALAAEGQGASAGAR
jgi:3-phenylpropionate/trans-cinnamate dioxygenase ferredoxin reductase subunit